MGTASKVISVLLRIFELCCAGIVLGILGHFFHVLHLGNGSADGRLVYAEVIAGLSVAFSILLVPPLTYSFYAFPLDLAIFICWMVAFGLLDNLTASGTCSSFWYWDYWGYYWGRFWYIPHGSVNLAVVGSIGCPEWRAVLAFSFLGGFGWLASFFLGLILIINRHSKLGPNTTRPKWDFHAGESYYMSSP